MDDLHTKTPAHYGNQVWPNWIDQTNPDTLVPIAAAAAADIVVVVAGGGGRHSAWMSGWVTRVCTEEVLRAGWRTILTGNRRSIGERR